MATSADPSTLAAANISANTDPTLGIENILYSELAQLDGINGHNPDTGRAVHSGAMLGQYTTRLFGAPYQFLDSVDRRFPNINSYVGTEYLRNFLLNSPILNIRPGMPQYTGDSPKSVATALRDIMLCDADVWQTLGLTLAGNTIFRKGKQLQRRMFGFRETYQSYMQHVNYMCRSVAAYMGLTGEGAELGTFVTSSSKSLEFQPFSSIRWENYRLFNNYVKTVKEYMFSLAGAIPGQTGHMLGRTLIGRAVKGIWNSISDEEANLAANTGDTGDGTDGDNTGDGTDNVDQTSGTDLPKTTLIDEVVANFKKYDGAVPFYTSQYDEDTQTTKTIVNPDIKSQIESFAKELDIDLGSATNDVIQSYDDLNDTKGQLFQVMDQKIKSVAFMVEPVGFNEEFSNTTEPSKIAQMVDGIGSEVGSEMAFITNSHADVGVLGELTKFIGGTVSGLAEKLADLVQPMTGGFVNHLFSGALGSIKGQKMIYPDIYKSSTSATNYNYSITLSSPYGDPYNYYMNIVVPYLHFMGLVWPRMVSANSTTSPFLVQTYIPGMTTCQLGIIENVSVQKNPDGKHVSVHGFPLTIKIEFSIKELYNSIAISPANDPVSFMFNETLNDYLINMSGLVPSATSYAKKRETLYKNLGEYFQQELLEDTFSGIVEGFENTLFTFN